MNVQKASVLLNFKHLLYLKTDKGKSVFIDIVDVNKKKNECTDIVCKKQSLSFTNLKWEEK